VLFATLLSTSHTLLDKGRGRTPITPDHLDAEGRQEPRIQPGALACSSIGCTRRNGAAEAGIKHHGGCG
jgi:hypothetical protein